MADEFDFDPGIKDDYIGTIREAHFEKGDNGTSLVLEINAEDGAEVRQFYRCGPDWDTYDGGETIEHPSKTSPNANTQLAEFTKKAMKSGAEATIRERSKALNSLGPKTSQLWAGLTFHWSVETKHVSFTNSAGELIERDTARAFPDEFIGVDETAPISASSTSSSTPVDDGSAMPETVRAQLTTLANEHDFDSFVNHAIEIEWVRSNILAELSDEGLYNTLKE